MTNEIPKNRRLLYAAVIILGIQAVFLIYTNLCLIPDTMDNDSAKVFVHAMEMWKNKTAFIPSWSNMTTLELDSPLLPAVLIYGLSHNIIVSFGVANILTAAFTAFVFCRIMRRLQLESDVIILTLALLFIPYSFGQLLYYNMTFFAAGQYAVKALVPIMMTDVLSAGMVTNESRKTRAVFTIITCVLVFVCALSSGIYVFLTGLLPVIICYVWFEIPGRDSFKKAVSDRGTLLCALTVLLSFAGAYISHRRGVGSVSESVTLMVSGKVTESLSAAANVWFELLGAFPYESEKLFSVTVISCVFKILLAVLSIVVIVISVKESFKDVVDVASSEDRTSPRCIYAYIRASLTAIVAFDTLILWMTQMSDQPRYFAGAVYAVIILSGSLLERLKGYTRKFRRNYAYIFMPAIVAVVFVVAVTSDILVLQGKCWPKFLEDNKKLGPLMDCINENDEQLIVFLNDASTAEQLRAIDCDSERLILTYKPDGDEEDAAGFVAHDYYTDVTQSASLDSPNLLVVNEYLADMDQLPEEIRNSYVEAGRYQNFTVWKHTD